MNKYLVILAYLCSSFAIIAQEDTKEVDSLKINLKEEGIVLDANSVKKRKTYNPLAPSKAAFYSAILPGLGQIYNKRYWKVPLVYGAIGTGIYAYTFNDNQYNRLRIAFKRRSAGFLDDEFYNPDGNGANANYSLTVLQDKQEDFQESRDLSLVITIVLYVLNIVDANVDAHLQQYNIDDDLSIDFKPFFDLDPITSNPNYGMGFTINF